MVSSSVNAVGSIDSGLLKSMPVWIPVGSWCQNSDLTSGLHAKPGNPETKEENYNSPELSMTQSRSGWAFITLQHKTIISGRAPSKKRVNHPFAKRGIPSKSVMSNCTPSPLPPHFRTAASSRSCRRPTATTDDPFLTIVSAKSAPIPLVAP